MQVPAGADGLESVVQGEYGSLVLLTLRSRDSGRRYEVVLKRHVKKETPIATVSPRAQRAGRPTQSARSERHAAVSLVRAAVQSLRKLVLRMDRDAPLEQEEHGLAVQPTSIGITFAASSPAWPSASKRITGLVPGGPALLGESLQEGDILVSVDGVGLSGLAPSTDVTALVRANDRIGSHVSLKIQRGAQVKEVLVNRTAVDGMERAQALFDSIAALSRRPSPPALSAAEEYQDAIQQTFTAAMQVERGRQMAECNQASALLDMQSRLLSHLMTIDGLLDQIYGASSDDDGHPSEIRPAGPVRCPGCQHLEEQVHAQARALQVACSHPFGCFASAGGSCAFILEGCLCCRSIGLTTARLASNGIKRRQLTVEKLQRSTTLSRPCAGQSWPCWCRCYPFLRFSLRFFVLSLVWAVIFILRRAGSWRRAQGCWMRVTKPLFCLALKLRISNAPTR
jgi:hypothetical protein